MVKEVEAEQQALAVIDWRRRDRLEAAATAREVPGRAAEEEKAHPPPLALHSTARQR